MARAPGPSDTLALSRNLAGLGVYILHGDADDNVPVGQARQMRQVLGEFHPDFAYHEQPGAGHWWGNPCVDWPPLFAFLGDHRIPGLGSSATDRFHHGQPGRFVTRTLADDRGAAQGAGAQQGASRARPGAPTVPRHHRECRPAGARSGTGLSRREGDGPIRGRAGRTSAASRFRGFHAFERQSVDLAGSHGRHVVGQSVAAVSVTKRPASPGPVQGGVSQPVRPRLRNQGDGRGKRLVARPGAVRRRDVLVSRQRLGRYRLRYALPRLRHGTRSFATAM